MSRFASFAVLWMKRTAAVEWLAFLFLSTLLLSPVCTGQAATGVPNFSAYDSHAYETVDLMSNTIVLNVSVLSKGGAFPFQLSLSANSGIFAASTNTWMPFMMDTSNQFWAGEPFGRQVNGVTLDTLIQAVAYATTITSGTCNGAATSVFGHWVVVTGPGTLHPLPATDYLNTNTGGNCKNTFTDQTMDASGLTLTESTAGTGGTISLYDSRGTSIPVAPPTQVWNFIDRNGNVVTESGNFTIPLNRDVSAAFTDSMGQTVLSYNYVHSSATGTYSWTDVSQGITIPSLTQTTSFIGLQTNFACGSGYPADLNALSSYPFTTGFTFADRTSLGIAYEQTPGNSTKVTGRLYRLTLPEGGTITYTYGGSHNGLDCNHQTVPVLTRQLGNGQTTTYNLAYSQIGTSANYRAINTVTDPGTNRTLYQFTGFTSTGNNPAYVPVLTQVTHYQGSSTLLETERFCYNQTFSQCMTNIGTLQDLQITGPTTSRIAFRQISGETTWSATEEHYDSYGNVTYFAVYDYGQTSPTKELLTTYGTWNGTTCVAITNANVKNTSCDVIQHVSGITVGETRFTYDSNGNLLKSSSCANCADPNSFVGQTSSNVYNPNGTISKSFDMNNNETDYAYSSAGYSQCTGCTQYPFPTQITNVGTGNYTNYTYYGQGGVVNATSDRNGATITNKYVTASGAADPYWRALQVVDPNLNTTYITPPSGTSPTVSSTSFTFNSNGSIIGTTTTVDGYNRPVDIQIPQSPTGSNYDTTSTAYSWNGNYARVSTSGTPCSTTVGASCSTTLTTDIDPIGRVIQISHGASYETLTHAYNGLDDYVQLTPAPPGENNKTGVTEYDGLGRPRINCRIGAGFTNSCGTATGSYQGVADTYQYGAVAPQGGPTQTYTRADRIDGSNDQYVYHAYDGLGRLVDIQPSFGPLQLWYYDAQTSNCSGATASIGNVVCYKDGINQIIYLYDSQNRITDEGAGAAGSTICRRFRYDNTSGVLGSIPSGITLSNQYGRLVEAETDDCSLPITSAHQITDEWFAYDPAGNITDMWQKSPNSTQYYHSHATFFENGAPKTVQLASPAFYTMTFGLEGEGRLKSVIDSTHSRTIVNSATYYPGANPAGTTIFGTDSDSFTFDSNTGNMTEYKYTVNGTNYTGDLTWNPNGTLRKLVTTDGFNSGGTQTCYFNPMDAALTGYDDFGHLVGFDCGGINWGQTFSFDAFENITKSKITGRAGTTWNPGYNLTNNHYNIGSYDSNGNVTSDGNFNYGWNEFGKMKSATNGGTPTCGTSGRCITYDALGRTIETSSASNWTERWYTQAGRVTMNGTSINFAYWPAPHNGRVYEGGNGGSFFLMHPDWLGSARVISNSAHAINGDIQYSPYGEVTAQFGSPAIGWFEFAGMTENFYKGAMFEAEARQFAIAGNRWLSHDPAGQGWNQYAYSTNPNSFIDPLGLCDLIAGGITQTPNTPQTQQQQAVADQLGANLAFPFSGQSTLGSLIGASFGDLSQQVLANAIINTVNQSAGGPTNLYLFSGSAGTFASVYPSLPANVQAGITSVTYFSPGQPSVLGPSLPLLQITPGPVSVASNVIVGSTPWDQTVDGFITNPGTALNCDHSANCEFGNFNNLLQNGGVPGNSTPCPNRETFTRQNPTATNPGPYYPSIPVFDYSILNYMEYLRSLEEEEE